MGAVPTKDHGDIDRMIDSDLRRWRLKRFACRLIKRIMRLFGG